MAKTHRLVGGSTALATGVGLGMPVAIVVGTVAFSAFASTFPDDFERPVAIKLGKRKLTLWPGLPHRQITHYPILQLAAVIALASLLLSASPLPDELVLYFAGALAIAWVMHSVADAMTIDRRGIALLWPIKRRGYHLMPRALRTEVGSSSPSEVVFGVVWVLFVLCFTYARLRHSLPS